MEQYYIKGQVLYLSPSGMVKASSKTKERIIPAIDKEAAINEFLFLEAGLANAKFKGECSIAINSFDRNDT